MPSRAENLQILGLAPPASPEEIRSAYRDLAQVWHPDRFAHSPELQRKAEEKMKEINEAYEALKDSPADPGAETETGDAWSAEPQRQRAAANPAFYQQEPARRTAPIKPSGMSGFFWPLLFLLAGAATWAGYRYSQSGGSGTSTTQTLRSTADGTVIAGLSRAGASKGGAIARGASPRSVLAALGKPDSKENLGGLEVWHYGRSTVLFSKGAVTGWENAGDLLLTQPAPSKH